MKNAITNTYIMVGVANSMNSALSMVAAYWPKSRETNGARINATHNSSVIKKDADYTFTKQLVYYKKNILLKGVFILL